MTPWEVLAWAGVVCVVLVLLALAVALGVVIVKAALSSTPRREAKSDDILGGTR